MAERNDFSGIWHCVYWFPSNNHPGDDTSEYYVDGHQDGDKLVLESLPQPSGAYILIRMTVEDNVAIGYWQEHTSSQGEFGGAIYSGAMQLLVHKDGQSMEGLWVGIGQDRAANKPRIYSGRWKLERASQPAAAAFTKNGPGAAPKAA